jgi:hypothetical protein
MPGANRPRLKVDRPAARFSFKGTVFVVDSSKGSIDLLNGRTGRGTCEIEYL